MGQAIIATIVFSGFVALTMLGFFIWGLLTHQFSNVQETSRRMLRNNLQPPSGIDQGARAEERNPQGGEKK